jgi:Reverse transcriptase (RNA-dependent DNA polymerase)
VVRGFKQREGLDFHETFASVVKPISYKAIFALAAAYDWELKQMDVKTAFLYGNIDKDIWIDLPTGYRVTSTAKLKKALYGLKQSPRV